MLSSDYSGSGNNIYCKPFLTGYNSFIENDAVSPLWSSKSMFHKEYLQVQVLADEEVPLEKSTDDVLNMNTYLCHICNIEVPKSYMTEHNDGNKHKTCLKIIDLVLERSRQHINLNVKEPRLSIRVSESYFCEPCAIVVQKKDKLSHELSITHKNSLKYDEIINIFLNIYKDKSNIDLVAKDFMSDQNEVNYQDIIDSVNKNATKNLHEFIENIEDTEQSPTIEQTESQLVPENVSALQPVLKTDQDTVQPDTSTKELEVPSTSKKMIQKSNSEKKPKEKKCSKSTTQLEDYLKTVTEKCTTYPIHSVEALTDKLVLITAINGDKVRVPLLSFHSIHNQKDKSYCKICEEPNVDYNHEYSEEHMEKIMIPIEDQNAMRKIDDIWSHCVLCNDLTKNTTFHLQSLLHRNKVKHSLVNTGTDINQNLLPQTSSTSHLIQEHSLIITNNQEITCNICNLTIQNNTLSIENHVRMFDHISNYNRTIEMNELNEIDDTQFYCTACDMCVSKSHALGHCNGKKHNKNLTDFINKVTEGDECTQVILPSISQQIKRTRKYRSDCDLICFVCNITLYNIDKHMNSLEHKRSYFTYLESNKLNEIEEDTFFCIPCNTVILIDYLMSHCTSKKHKTHIKNFMSNTHITNNTTQVIETNTHISRSIAQSVENAQSLSMPEKPPQNGVFDTAIPLKFIYQFREMSNSRNLLCIICDEEVPYRKYDVQSHVNITDHVVAFNLMMLWNKIKRLNDNYYCDVCKVDITYFNELAHILSATHVDVMANSQKGTVYEYDKKLLTIEYAMSHKVGDRVRPSLISVAKVKGNL